MKACVFTLGCKMNEVESASIVRGLAERGYETADTPCVADLYLINTCAVTAEAERKSRQAVARLRKFNPAARVIVFGCASERCAEQFTAREGVTFVAGAMRKDKILDMLGEEGVFHGTETAFCGLPAPASSRTRAFLRIQDGCNRFCSYCIIPYLRGRTRSRRADDVLAEANACGAKEIVLTGIDISSYRDGDCGLGDLLLKLKDVPARVRLGSLEEGIVTDGFLRKARDAGNVCPHFHLSLQSGSTRVLRAMNRHYTREQFLEACEKIYAYFPSAAITTDIIAGFPTETEEDFLQSLSIIEEAGLARVHVFPFSPREGTAAAKLRDLPREVKKERAARLIAAGKEAARAYVMRASGTVAAALFEDDGGYTETYIRAYAEGAKTGGMYEVRLIKPYRDGAYAEIIKEII